MQKVVTPGRRRGKIGWASFTLVELLVVMAIIAILAALVLAAASGAMATAARSRARAEIASISSNVENYKADNGVYPQSSTLLNTTPTTPYNSTSLDGTSVNYQTASQVLFSSLSGKLNFTDTSLISPTTKVYMTFRRNQVGDAGSGSYLQDPWSYSYGYSTGSAAGASSPTYPINGNGFFDLWTTGGALASATATNSWISNWSPQ